MVRKGLSVGKGRLDRKGPWEKPVLLDRRDPAAHPVRLVLRDLPVRPALLVRKVR